MKKIFLIIFVVINLLAKDTIAQGTDCSTASPFCTAVPATFPAQQNTTAPVGPNYGCLGSQPNPAWFYLQISTAGPVTLDMSNSASVDIDYIIWGPFTSPAAACSSGLTGTAVDCSYSSSATESGTIPSALIGEVYVLLITNYSNQPTTISLAQNGGSGATNCNIVCAMTAITAVPGACVSPTNIYDLSGTITYSAPPTTGTLTVTNSCSGATQVFNAPFDAASESYTLTGLSSNGASCTVTAVFSADPNCTFTQTFTSPAPCYVDCPIIVDSAHTCIGVPTTITASGATSYLWSTGETTASIMISGVAASYTVIGTTGTCSDTATSIVTTFPPPTVGFFADTVNGCGSFSVNFMADTIGNAGASYSWNLGEGATGSGVEPTHTYTVPGCHTVILTASFGQGCSTTDSLSCMITVFAQSEANFNMAPAEIDMIAPTAYFSNTSINATSWLWNFGDTTSSVEENPEHIYSDVGTYPVTLYTSTINGCVDSITYMLLVKDIITNYIPNAFTPNKNEHNDVFNIYSYGISPDNYELLIFDRWGNRVFKTNNLHEGWNGALNNVGDVLEMNTYVYHLSYQELTGKKRNIIGHVTLLK